MIAALVDVALTVLGPGTGTHFSFERYTQAFILLCKTTQKTVKRYMYTVVADRSLLLFPLVWLVRDWRRCAEHFDL